MVKEIYEDIPHLKQTKIPRLNEVIVNFVSAFRKKTNILKLLCYAKSKEEYSYIHATNVSVLSIFQMETLGVKDRLFCVISALQGFSMMLASYLFQKNHSEKRALLQKKNGK